MFEDFDFGLLEKPDFKEDSVREEIIVPILKFLGYSASKPNQIIRSKTLKHPFVNVGTNKKQIKLIPDYLLITNSNPYWILDAKSPSQDIFSNINLEQAYSYAIHPEIRVKYFALCNGKEFALFSVLKEKPIIHFKLKNINIHLETLLRILHPDFLCREEVVEYDLDYGLFFYKMGLTPKTLLIDCIMPNLIAKINDSKYTVNAGKVIDNIGFCASYDFNKNQLKELLTVLPKEIANKVEEALSTQPFWINLDKFIENGQITEIMISSRLSDKVHSNNEEDYLPLKVESFKPLEDERNSP